MNTETIKKYCTAVIFLQMAVLLTSCASYEEYIKLSREVIEEPKVKTYELLEDTSKVTEGFIRNFQYNFEKAMELHLKFLNEDFRPEMTEFYDTDTYTLHDPRTDVKYKMLDVKFVSQQKYILLFRFWWDESVDKYKLSSISYGNLELNPELRK